MKEKNRKYLLFIIFLGGISIIIIPMFVFAHPGRTASDGCHYCRTNCSSWGVAWNQRHCHGGSTYTPEPYSPPSYNPPSYVPSIPDCPLNSYYDSVSSSCKCYSGYVVSGEKCISADQYCRDLFGFNAQHNILTDNCECSYGYIFSDNKCISGDSHCRSKYGIYSSYESFSESCKCDYGYVFDSSNKCISRDDHCKDLYGYNVEYDILTDGCVCQRGYVLNNLKTKCVDGNSYCQDKYGYYANYDYWEEVCKCDDGYKMKNGQCVTPEISRAFPLEVEIDEEVTVQGKNFGDSKYSDLSLYIGSIKVNSLDILRWYDNKIVFNARDYLGSGNIILKGDAVNIRGPYLEILEKEENNLPVYSFTPPEIIIEPEPQPEQESQTNPEEFESIEETQPEIQFTDEEPQLSDFQETGEDEEQVIAEEEKEEKEESEEKQEKKRSVRVFFANVLNSVKNFFSKIFKWF